MEEKIKVSAGLIFDEFNNFLLSTRPSGKIFAGYWELAGGKLERGESFKTALIRECKEELGIEVGALKFFGEFFHSYPHAKVQLQIFIAEKENWSGKIKAKEGQKFLWLNLDNLEQDLKIKNPSPLLPTTEKILKLLKARNQALKQTTAHC